MSFETNTRGTCAREDGFSNDKKRVGAMTDDERRALWKKWCASDVRHPLPEACRGLTCGAKTRAGTPCKRRDLYSSGRCKLHGGLSTGPRSAEGKARSALNGKAHDTPIVTPRDTMGS